MGASRLPHGGEDGQRHGQLQGAGEVHHQHRQGSCHIPGEGKADEAPGEGIGHQLVRQIGGLALGLRLHLLRLLDHVNDLVIAALAGGLLYLQHTFALLYHGAGIDRAAGALGYRDGLPGEGRLVDGDFPLQHQTVHRHDAAGADDHGVPRLDLGHRNQHLALGRAQPDPVHIQRHTPGQIRHRFLPCPLLQQFTYLQQEHDHSGGSKVPSAGGNGNRQGIQQLHLDAAAQQAVQSSPYKGDHVPENTGNPQWGREKQGTGSFAHYLSYQLLLKFPVQRPAAVGGQRGGPLRLLPGKMPNFVQHGLASPIVVQDDAAGSLMDGDLPAPGLSLNPCLQQIRLSERHLFLPQPEPDAPPAFVQYGCVHRFLLHEKREPLAAPSGSISLLRSPDWQRRLPPLPSQLGPHSAPWRRPECPRRFPAPWSQSP